MAVRSCGDFNALPESCIAIILSLTTPKDACRLALVSTTFLSASLSDSVWDRFLPSDYRHIISRRAVGTSNSLLSEIPSKKDLYLYLCDHPILLDDGHKMFWLEKPTGKKCFMLSSRELSIVWSDTPESWQWVSRPESRFSEVAELVDVCWLEIRGKINVAALSPNTNYAAYLVFNFNSRPYGFRNRVAEASVGLTSQNATKLYVCLESGRDAPWNFGYARRLVPIPSLTGEGSEGNVEYPYIRDDGWMEVELGEQFVVGRENDGELEASFMDAKGRRWKRDLIVEGIEIRPK